MLDSLNIRTVGSWPFSRAGLDICPVSESILYVESGRGLYVLDISNPSAITKLDSFVKPGGWGRAGMSVSNNHCLFGEFKAGVALYDITNKRHPVLLSTYITPYIAGRSQLIGRYGFIAANGLRILDYEDPYHPVEIGRYESPYSTNAVFVKDNYAYLADDVGGFRIIDISDRANPVEVFQHQISDYAAYGIWVEDTFAYIAWGIKGLRIWNVSNPNAPYEVATWNDYIYYVQAVDTLLYCIRFFGATEYLYILNVANPSQPQVISRYGSIGMELWGTICGNRGYVLTSLSTYPYVDTLTILDLSDPRNPTPLGKFSQFHAHTDGIFVLGNYVYAATRGQGMKFYDVTEPSNPRLISQIGSWNINQIVVQNRVAYLACWDGPVLRTVDVSDPSNPVLLGSLDSAGYSDALGVQDSLVILSNGSNVWLVNVADPSQPRILATIPLQYTWAHRIAVDGNILYITDQWAGLKIYDIQNPYAPESLSRYNAECAVTGVAVKFPYVYIGGGKFIVLDVSDLGNPVLIAELPVTDYIQCIDIEGNIAYCAQSYGGVRAYDISDPYNPFEIGFYVTPSFANQVQAIGDKIYVADSDGWLILQYYGQGVEEKGKWGSAAGRVEVLYESAAQTLRVRLSSPKEKIKALEVFNSAGIKVCSVGGKALPSGSEVTISPLTVPAGVYFIKLFTKCTTYNAKFTVCR